MWHQGRLDCFCLMINIEGYQQGTAINFEKFDKLNMIGGGGYHLAGIHIYLRFFPNYIGKLLDTHQASSDLTSQLH